MRSDDALILYFKKKKKKKKCLGMVSRCRVLSQSTVMLMSFLRQELIQFLVERDSLGLRQRNVDNTF